MSITVAVTVRFIISGSCKPVMLRMHDRYKNNNTCSGTVAGCTHQEIQNAKSYLRFDDY